MNFVNINEENNIPSINLKNIKIEQEPVKEIIITPVEVVAPEEKEEKEGCIQAECPVTVGCSEEYFAIKNLFSELTDDYQRAIIRQNLGIADTGALLWGKIGGNLANQKDLYKFISDALRSDEQGILDQVNLELKYWTQYIENKIESLASNITSIEIIPRYATSNQIPVDILVTWEYAQPVEAQTINNLVIDPEVRTYIFKDIKESFTVRLSYYYNEVWLARNVNFDISFPTYYGTSPNYEECQYTIQDKVKVTAGEGEYIYVITKKPSDLSVNGIIGGFIYEGTTYISSIRYYVYKSLNPNLGETIVRIHDKE